MCPMRVFLFLFSAALACYLAWRNYSKGDQLSLLQEPGEHRSEETKTTALDTNASEQQVNIKLPASFWTVFDMFSGRYLWKGIKSLDAVTTSMNSRPTPH